jgi:hypothetical protein
VPPDGRAVITYYSSVTTALKIAKCADVNCNSAGTAVVDQPGVGQYSSVVIGVDGLPIISYHDINGGNLKVAKCQTSNCVSFTTSVVDSNGTVGQYTSITIGADGLPVVAYRDVDSAALKFAHCGDISCSTATVVTVDGAGSLLNMGEFATMVRTGDDKPLIAFYDRIQADLRIAHCPNAMCAPYFRRR